MFSKTTFTFSQIWNIKTDWFEEPNHRRGGWSGVVKYELPTNEGSTDVFIKRQENHFSRTWRHPFTGLPTFEKEFLNIQRLIKHQLPTLDVVFFGVERKRAILVTKALNDYISLDQIEPEIISSKERKHLLICIANVMRKMHAAHIQHSSFYPKHIFVRQNGDGWDIKIIDLENMKKRLFIRHILMRDLSTLDRHAGFKWCTKDRITFLKAYFLETSLSKRSKKLWHTLQHKDKYKRR